MRGMTLSFEKPDKIYQFLIHGGQALGKSQCKGLLQNWEVYVARWQQKEREI